MNPEGTFHAGLSGVPHTPTPMNPIDIIKEALERILFLNSCELEGIGSGQPTPNDWHSAMADLTNALIALDSLTVKVSDEEIDRMVLEDLTDDSHVGLGLTHEGALAIARTFLGRGLRIARDNDPAANRSGCL